MRMRTSVLVLVQVTALFFPAISALAADSGGYGSGEYSAPQSASEPTQEAPQRATRGTVVSMPDAFDAPRNTTESAPASRSDTPPRGMSKSRVLARYGKPMSQGQPVGQPPITRWDYPGYRLYFEYDHVLHAVVPDLPEPIAHSDELHTGH